MSLCIFCLWPPTHASTSFTCTSWFIGCGKQGEQCGKCCSFPIIACYSHLRKLWMGKLPTCCHPLRYRNTSCQQSGYCCLAKQQSMWCGNLQNLMFLRHTGWLAVRLQHTHCFHSLSEPAHYTEGCLLLQFSADSLFSLFMTQGMMKSFRFVLCYLLLTLQGKSSLTNSKATSGQHIWSIRS